MKIGLVCPYDMFRGGGVQEHVQAQALELRKRGHIVKILTPRPFVFKGRPPKNTIFIGTSTKVRTPIKTTLELGVSLARDAVDDILAKEQFDILHVHEPEVPVLGAQIVAKARCPIVASFHAMFPDTPMAWTIEAFRIPYSKSIFSRLSEISAVSDVAASFVHERTNRHVTIIPNGIDLKKYVKNPAEPSRLRSKLPLAAKIHRPAQKPMLTILYVGRLEARKGVKYLLKAFEKLTDHDPNVRLIIAGDGAEREKLEDMVKYRDIPRVKFLGYVSDKRKLKLFSEADLFCAPALYGESFGIVLLEAVAMGVVTVAGNNPGYSGMLQGTGQMSLVDPKDSAAFAARLDKLLHDQDLRQQWRAWAASYVKQFDYPKIVNRYEKLYYKALKRQPEK